MPYAKGQSGNPKGRPKQTAEQKSQKEQFQRLLKSSTVEALQSIIQIANDRYNKDRFNACKYIIDKAYGANTAFLLDGTEDTAPTVIRIVPYGKENEDWNEDDWEDEWNNAPDCQTAHCGRGKSHFIFGGLASPIVPYRNLTQTTDGMTADCRSLV